MRIAAAPYPSPRVLVMRALCAGAVTLLAAGATPSLGDCLSSDVTCLGSPSTTTAATYQSSCVDPFDDATNLHFDVPGGVVHLYGLDHAGGDVVLRDEFLVQGLPAGTPVALRLRLRYHGTAGGFGPCCAVGGGVIGAHAISAQGGDQPAQTTYGAPVGYSGTISFSDSVDCVLARTAGTPVGIEIHVSTANGYDTDTNVQFAFIGLPQGAIVTSCKGYTQDQPVPAVVRSWGSVKAGYR